MNKLKLYGIIGTSNKETAPTVSRQASTARALTTEEAVIHEESSAPIAHPSTEERPCICYDGLVFIGRLELTEEGEEVEVVEAVPCRRCRR